MNLSPEFSSLLVSIIVPSLIAIFGFVLSNRSQAAKFESQKLVARAAVKKAADDALELARARLDQRNEAAMAALEKKYDILDKKKEESDSKNVALEQRIVDLEHKVEATAVDCKSKIDEVLAKLERALEGKGRAEAEAKAATSSASAATTGGGLVAAGTIELEVKDKDKQ